MSKLTRACLTVTCSMVLCGSAAIDAFAQATKVPTTGQQFFVGVVDPGITFVSEDGVIHTRNQILQYFQVGDLEGDVITVNNTEYDPATCQGRAHGTASFSGTHLASGREGTFAGTFVADFGSEPDGFGGCTFPATATGQGVLAQGTDGFTGMKRFSTQVGTIPFFAEYSGYILDPSGTLQP